MNTPANSRKGGCSGCGGCLVTLLVVVVVIAVATAFLYRAATTPYLNLAVVASSSAAADSAQKKLNQVTTAVDQAHSSGKPVRFSITLSDAEMTSLASSAVATVEQTGTVPGIDQIVIHAAGSGVLQVEARVHFPLATVPVYLALHISSPDQKSFSVTVTEARVGTIPLPASVVGGIVDQVRRQLISRLNVSVAQGPTYDHASVTVADGRLTVGATVEP